MCRAFCTELDNARTSVLLPLEQDLNDVDWPRTRRAAIEAPKYLSKLPNLKDIQLYGPIYDGQLVPPDVTSAILARSGLTSLLVTRGWDTIPTQLSTLLSLNFLSLRRLNVDFSPIAACSSLTELHIEDCNVIDGDLTTLTSCSTLSQLCALSIYNDSDYDEVHRTTDIEDIGPLGVLTNLTSLRLCQLFGVESFDAIGSCTRLKVLEVWGCPGSLDGCIRRLSSLTKLELLSCSGLSSLEPISHVTLLETLCVKWCSNINNPSQFQWLEWCLPNLKELKCNYENVVLRGGRICVEMPVIDVIDLT